jgi:hypothetical protein
MLIGLKLISVALMVVRAAEVNHGNGQGKKSLFLSNG